jgi:hypothetical protein
VYFSVCCEPAAGLTYRIPVRGGEPEPFAIGAHPRLSPDGSDLAVSGSGTLSIVRTDDPSAPPATIEVRCCARSLAWSPDGTQLAVVTSSGRAGEMSQVQLFEWDGTTVAPGDMGKPDDPGSFVSWTPQGVLNLSSGEPVDDDRSLSQDVTYGWLLWVDEAGVVREQAGHESGDRTPVAGLPEALVADW